MGIFNTKEERDERRKAWKVKQENAGMFLVDPNPPGRGVLPTEDMFIYVKFTARERSRGIATLDGNDNPKYIDLLDVDKPIAAQNFVCLSFISPEKTLKQKEIYLDSQTIS